MMDTLYSKALLRLAADAHGAGRLERADARIDAASPICGDRIHLDVLLIKGAIAALAHETRDCVITQASISLLAKAAPGMDLAALVLAEVQLETWFAGGPGPEGSLSEFGVFADLKDHPARQACVMLPFKAAIKALKSV